MLIVFNFQKLIMQSKNTVSESQTLYCTLSNAILIFSLKCIVFILLRVEFQGNETVRLSTQL